MNLACGLVCGVALLSVVSALNIETIVRTVAGGSVSCPVGSSCELVCRGPRACADLEGGTGNFSKITCDSDGEGIKRGDGACDGATIPNVTEHAELVCKGDYACHQLKGSQSTGHFSKITCDSTFIGENRVAWHFDKIFTQEGINVCLFATLPDVPEGETSELVCKGEAACRYLLGGTGHYSQISCIGDNACSYLLLPTIPLGSTSHLLCEGSEACLGLKGGVGNYTHLTCNGYQACLGATVPALPEGDTFELLCRGQRACYKLKGGFQENIDGLPRGVKTFTRLTCDTNRACKEETVSADEWTASARFFVYNFDETLNQASRSEFYAQTASYGAHGQKMTD